MALSYRALYDILLVIRGNYVSTLYRFQDIALDYGVGGYM